MKPTLRDRTRLNASVLAELEQFESHVTWEPLLAFDEDVDPDPNKTDGTRPYEPGGSLMDRDRRGHFKVDHSRQWSGALRFSIADDSQTVELMLDAGQIEHLVGAIQLWQHGTTHNAAGDFRVPKFVPGDV